MTNQPKTLEYFYVGVGTLSLILVITEYFFDTPLDPAGKLMMEGFFNVLFKGKNFFVPLFLVLFFVCFAPPVVNWIQPLNAEKVSKTSRVLIVARRWLVGCCVFAFLFLGLYEISQEILVRIYMHGTYELERSDFSEDYGLGMLGVFSSLAYVIIAFPTLLYFVYKFFKNR